jgi:hypothetical protein
VDGNGLPEMPHMYKVWLVVSHRGVMSTASDWPTRLCRSAPLDLGLRSEATWYRMAIWFRHCRVRDL